MNIGSTTIPETLREGRYTLGRILGQGGMAVVTTAFDNELGVDRAVKLLLASGHQRTTLRRRLRSEARAMARLHHPNILSIHDVGAEGELDYVVMDLATGGSLQDVLGENGPMRPSVAIQYLIQVLSALAAAHAAGIVHRDVKPHNILLDAQGRALLADFGIALLTGDDRRTRSGVAMGSLAFMPPEQRLDAAKVGPSADIYAAGSTLFNLLTGENPVDLFLASDRSPRWENVNEPIKQVLLKACRMEPEERWETAGDMAYALLEILRSDSDGLSTAEGPFGPSFPAPSQGFSKHTNSSATDGGTLLPPQASSATAHAVEALAQVAAAPVDPLGEHQPTVTSHAPTPEVAHGEPSTFDTWAPTIPDASPVSPPPERRVPQVVLGAAAVVLLFLLAWGAWWAVGTSSTDATTPAPSPATTLQPPEPAPQDTDIEEPVVEEPKIDEPAAQPHTPEAPVPSAPAPESAPEPVNQPVVAATIASRPAPVAASGPPSAVRGHWEGTMGGAWVDLQLQGSDGMLRGTMKTSIGSRISEQPVGGTYDPASRSVLLRETDARPPARFELRLDGSRLDGAVIKATGGRGPLILERR